jgi:hypothetical protein
MQAVKRRTMTIEHAVRGRLKGSGRQVIDLARVLLDWHVLLIGGCLLVILPVVFFVSSLDKSAVKIKRVKIKRAKPAAVKKPVGAPAEPRDHDDDVVPAPRAERRRQP